MKPSAVRLDRSACSLLLAVEASALGPLPPAISHAGREFQRKREFHLTILGRTAGASVRAALGEAAMDEGASGEWPARIEELEHLVAGTDWSFTLSEAYRHLGKAGPHESEEGAGGSTPSESLVRMADMPALAGFFACLNELTGLALPVPPAHVTLYTFGDPDGISLPSDEVLARRLVAPIPPEQWAELLRAAR